MNTLYNEIDRYCCDWLSNLMDSSHRERSMTDESRSSDPTTSEDTNECISSPASLDGISPCSLLDGQQLDLFGQEAVPASPLAPLAAAKQLLTNGTSGLNGRGLSALYDRQQSLANRLKLFAMTWERKAGIARKSGTAWISWGGKSMA